jgi:CheY-like chemotaxis protein
MAKRIHSTSARAWRPARTAIQGIRAKLGDMECTVANISQTGAMVRGRGEMPVGSEVKLLLEFEPRPVTVRARVVRCEAVDVELPGEAVWRRKDYSLGVHFIDRTPELAAAIRDATNQTTGIEQSQARILVLGKEDDVSTLIERTLSEADYKPRVLTHARYAISTAKRIGAKAVVVNLELDREFSARTVLDTLRSDPATQQLPIVICARQAWLQPTYRSYITDKRLRLLLVPFTPEELIATVDKAIEEAQ